MFPAIIISIFGIASAICWGTADFFAAKASRRTSPESAVWWVSIIGTLAFAVIYLVYPGELSWTRNGILYAAGAGVSLEIGLLMLFRGLEVGPVSVVSPVSSAYPLISTLITLAIFGGSLRPSDMLGIIITVVGVVITSGLFSIKRTEKKLTAGVVYALLALVLWGIAYALLGRAVTTLGWQKSALIDTCSGLLVLTIVLALTTKQKLWVRIKNKSFKDPYVLGSAFAQLLAGIIFTIGLAHARSTAVITTIAATYPALTIFLALKHFGERKQIISIAGSVVAITGVVILSL